MGHYGLGQQPSWCMCSVPCPRKHQTLDSRLQSLSCALAERHWRRVPKPCRILSANAHLQWVDQTRHVSPEARDAAWVWCKRQRAKLGRQTSKPRTQIKPLRFPWHDHRPSRCCSRSTDSISSLRSRAVISFSSLLSSLLFFFPSLSTSLHPFSPPFFTSTCLS